MRLAATIGRFIGIGGTAAAEPGAAGRSISRTHVGRVRTLNEDRVVDRHDEGLWAVIDGMGGHQDGAAAADAVFRTLSAIADRGTPDAKDVVSALRAVNRALYEAGRDAGQVRGATIAVAIRADDGLALFWAGDCRVVLLRDGRATRLTRDHSLVQELVDSGQLSEDMAQSHPRSNVVTRALGAAEDIAIETRRVSLRDRDTILICSDGLDRPEATLAALATHSPSLSALADDLLGSALDRGGRDNISLILIDPRHDPREFSAGLG